MTKNFESRRDRFEFFDSFESPLLNLTFRLEVPSFLPYCEKEQIPPFHFFLYCLYRALGSIDNFLYRMHEGEIIKVEKITASYTVLDKNGNLNFTRFDAHEDLREFIRRSLEAKKIAEGTDKLINTGHDLGPREIKDYVFITSIPWLDFTSIQHPVFKFKSADIPSIAWGKFTELSEGKLQMPFSVQAHHGFVDGVHLHQLGESIAREIQKVLAG